MTALLCWVSIDRPGMIWGDSGQACTRKNAIESRVVLMKIVVGLMWNTKEAEQSSH